MNDTLSICDTKIINATAPQAKQGFDVWLYLAYACILLSYININILIFRLWLVLSSIFFVIWSFVPERSVQVDSLIYNLLFIVINIAQSIPLFKAIWPVKLTELEKEVFERDFYNHMSERQFKHLIKNFKPKMYSAHGSQMCCVRSNFEGLIYIAKLNPGWKVAIHRENTGKFQDLYEGSWIGTIEYMIESEKKEKNAVVIWGVTAVLEEEDRVEDENLVTELRMITKDNAGCIVYFFDLEKLYEIYDDSTYPMFYKNAIKAIWLDYTTKYIVKQDLNLTDNYDDEDEYIGSPGSPLNSKSPVDRRSNRKSMKDVGVIQLHRL